MKKGYGWHIVLIVYIVFIFSNSLTPSDISSENSGFVLELAHRLLNMVGVSALWLTDHVIRKSAHFAEYTLLGILLFQSMRHLPEKRSISVWNHMSALLFLPFVDETLQLFTEGRSGQISDVWLDMGGAVFGTMLCLLWVRIFRRHS